ncbi:MAG: hypothetical protein AAF495_09020 [Pseudomonadota bacterium]
MDRLRAHLWHDVPLRPGEVRSLWLLGPPLLVMVLAGLIFEVGASDLAGLQAHLARVVSGAAEQDMILGLAETRARLVWGTAVLMASLAGIALVVAALVVLWRSLSLAGFGLYFGIGLLFSLAGGLHLILSGRSDSGIAAVFTFTYGSFAHSQHLESAELVIVEALVHGLNGLGVSAPAFGLMAACATLSPGPSGHGGDPAAADLANLQRRMRYLKTLLNLGSAVLVLGILHLVVWIRWPAALIPDPAVARQILGLSTALGLYWGAAFTLLIVAFYVPASFVISRRAQAVLARMPGEAGAPDVQSWMASMGLSIAPAQQLPQIAAMMAPLLAGPVGTLLNDLVSPLSG